ncbi:MAG: L,D-transpeptidase family protein [Anaerolineae bacterium]
MVSTSANAEEQLRLGLRAANARQMVTARRHFMAALNQDPNNVPALLWLAFLSSTPDDTRHLLRQVLRIDPDNERAQAGLRWLDGQQKPATNGPPGDRGLQLDEQAALEALRKKLAVDNLQEQARKGPSAQRARRRINPFLVVLLLFGAMTVALILAGAAIFQPAILLAARSPASQPTATPMPVAWQNPSPTATFTALPPPADTPAPTETPPPTPTATPVVTDTPAPPPPASAHRPADLRPGEKWIEVNVTTQQVTAWEGDLPVMNYVASTGLPNTPTVLGEYRIYVKLTSTRMAGPGYDLPNVPHTMYFHQGYALHGAYWHNNFGNPMSHGCVNLPLDSAEALFEWAAPVIPAGASYVYASADNPGTRVVVHR